MSILNLKILKHYFPFYGKEDKATKNKVEFEFERRGERHKTNMKFSRNKNFFLRRGL